jgi:hypothetical protein
MKLSRPFFIFAVALAAAIFFEWQFLLFTGRSFEWALAIIVAAAFFLEPIEVAALAFLSLWLFGGFLALGIGEAAVFATFPLVLSMVRTRLPVDSWLALALTIAGGVLLQAIFANLSFFTERIIFLLGDAFGSAAFGVIFFVIFSRFYKVHEAR